MVKSTLARTQAAKALVCMPDAAWARAASLFLRRRGIEVLVGPFDPWSVAERPLDIIASEGDPVAFLAQAARSAWRSTSPPDDGERDAFIELANSVLFTEVVYMDPFDRRPATCEQTIDLLADWRRVLTRNREVACCAGVSVWKRAAVGRLLHTGEAAPSFHAQARAAKVAAKRAKAVAIWSSRLRNGRGPRSAGMLHMEDGFVRSAGLGSGFTPPCSIVLDRRGPHYDPSRASDLEVLLTETEFGPALLRRAGRLIESLAASGVTKYSLPSNGEFRPPPGRRFALAIGQVEDDQSVQLGGAGVRTNLELLQRIRAAEPDAFIAYKPHPDVEAGHRRGRIPDAIALQHADVVVREPAISRLFRTFDCVHTLTSLAGFEALLRGCEVVLHGQPFYAGWGLTRDLAPVDRRQRVLSLSELAAGALILYPLYVDPRTGLPCSPELLVERLSNAAPRSTVLKTLRRWQGRIRALALAGRQGLWT